MSLFKRIVYSGDDKSGSYIATKKDFYKKLNARLIKSLCSSYSDLREKHNQVLNRLNAAIHKERVLFDWQLNENEILDVHGKDNQENRDILAGFFRVLLSHPLPEEDIVRPFVFQNSEVCFSVIQDCSLKANSFYDALSSDLIYSIFTEDIFFKDGAAHVFQKSDGFLAGIIKQLHKHNIFELTEDDIKNLSVKSFFEKCLLAYPVQKMNLAETNLSIFLENIMVPVLQELLPNKSEIGEALIQDDRVKNIPVLDVRVRIVTPEQLEALRKNRYIIADRPTMYILHQNGYFNALFPTAYTQNEYEWAQWLEFQMHKNAEEINDTQQDMQQTDWSFYLECISQIGFVSGGILLVLGVICMRLDLLIVSGIASIMGYCFFTPASVEIEATSDDWMMKP